MTIKLQYVCAAVNIFWYTGQTLLRERMYFWNWIYFLGPVSYNIYRLFLFWKSRTCFESSRLKDLLPPVVSEPVHRFAFVDSSVYVFVTKFFFQYCVRKLVKACGPRDFEILEFRLWRLGEELFIKFCYNELTNPESFFFSFI